MKNKNILFFVIILATPMIAFAAKKASNKPQAVKKTEQAGPVEVCGFGRFKDRIFNQRVNVNGKAEMDDVEAHKPININGSASIKNSTFHEAIDINGSADVYGSTFEGTITFEGSLVLDSCKAREIVVGNYSKKKLSKLSLKGKTTVSGDIIFEGEPGTVELRKEAKILGAVKNGKIVSKK